MVSLQLYLWKISPSHLDPLTRLLEMSDGITWHSNAKIRSEEQMGWPFSAQKGTGSKILRRYIWLRMWAFLRKSINRTMRKIGSKLLHLSCRLWYKYLLHHITMSNSCNTLHKRSHPTIPWHVLAFESSQTSMERNLELVWTERLVSPGCARRQRFCRQERLMQDKWTSWQVGGLSRSDESVWRKQAIRGKLVEASTS